MENTATISLDEAIIVKEYIKLGTVEEFRKLKEGCSVIREDHYYDNPYFSFITNIIAKDEAIKELSDNFDIQKEKSKELQEIMKKEIRVYEKRISEYSNELDKYKQLNFIQRLKYLFTREL